jgi:hypothetical protein
MTRLDKEVQVGVDTVSQSILAQIEDLQALTVRCIDQETTNRQVSQLIIL